MLTKDDRDLAALVGESIRVLREEAGMSKRELAQQVLSGPTETRLILDWEAGKRLPSLPTMAKICVLFDVSPNELLGWE